MRKPRDKLTPGAYLGLRFLAPLRSGTLLLAILLTVLTVASFHHVTTCQFLNYDDNLYVTENQHIQTGISWQTIKWAFTTDRAANWHPLTWVSHMIDWQLFQGDAGKHHLVNLILHILNTLLLFVLLTRMTRLPWRSAFVAGLFAVHPLHVESVAWIAERKDVLSTLFWMLTTYAYVRYTERGRVIWYLLTLVFYAFGLMSKPMLVTLPFVLLLLDHWPLRRLDAGKVSIRRLLMEKAPLLILSAASCVVTYLVQRRGQSVVPFTQYPLYLRLENALVSYVRYIWKMLHPHDLALLYPHPGRSLPLWQAVLSGILLIAITLLAVRMRHRRYFVVGWLWYIGTLVPTIGIIQVGMQSHADRYTYVPLIGLFIIIAWGLPDLMERARRRQTQQSPPPTKHAPHDDHLHPKPVRYVLGAMAVLTLLALALATNAQVGRWSDNVTLYKHVLSVTDGNYVIHNNLGVALYDAGLVGEAHHHFELACKTCPRYADPHINLGRIASDEGDLVTAEKEYRTAIMLKPCLATAHNNLGVILIKQGRIDEAIKSYRQALRLDPDMPAARSNLKSAMQAKHRMEQWLAEGRHSREQVYEVAARYELGRTAVEQGDLYAAAAHFEAALRLKPDFAEAHTNLGVVLARLGNMEQAISHLSEAVRLKPDYVEGHNNLAVALERQGRLREAIYHYSEAIRLKPDYAIAHKNIAVTLYAVGRYAEAWKEVHRAEELGQQCHPEFLHALSHAMPDPGG